MPKHALPRAFTHGDNEIDVRIFIPRNLAVLLENAFNELSATLMSHDEHVTAVSLTLRDSLLRSEKVEYWVVIALNAAFPNETGQLLAGEVARWRKEFLKISMTRPRLKSKSHTASFPRVPDSSQGLW